MRSPESPGNYEDSVRLGMSDSPLGWLGHSGGEWHESGGDGLWLLSQGGREDGEFSESTSHQVQRSSQREDEI